jgi:NADH-quinone oxidoreductase subunit D
MKLDPKVPHAFHVEVENDPFEDSMASPGRSTPEDAPDIEARPMILNMGPSHPAMHGVMRMLLTLQGELVLKADPEIGFMHRCFEKQSENATWTQVFPYTDRLNYSSSFTNNVAYAGAVEKLLDIQIPERAQYIRVLICEMSRIGDHLTCNGAGAMELGAFTVFLYMIQAREDFYRLAEDLCGARLTVSYVRIGGVKADLPAGYLERVEQAIKNTERLLIDCEKLVLRNRIFLDRCKGVGILSKEDAVSYGYTGPCLRATGIDYDVRKAHPYLVYDRFDFETAIGTQGDTLDRFLVRMEEIRQSIRIIRQLYKQISRGPILIDDPNIALPPKEAVYNTIEGMMRHFKLIMEGIKVPKGEAYYYTEGANGELGFYVVSDGGGGPYKCRPRSPGFALTSSLGQLLRGGQLADIIPVYGSINYIAGEVER